jgi:hypothetical protein
MRRSTPLGFPSKFSNSDIGSLVGGDAMWFCHISLMSEEAMLFGWYSKYKTGLISGLVGLLGRGGYHRTLLRV